MRWGSFGWLRRAATVVLCSGVVTGGLVAVASPPAAASTPTQILASSSALVDSATPHTRNVDPTSIPVGTHVDAAGVAHTTRGYFTFDVSRLVGHELLNATYLLPETAAADCSVPTAPQAWLTSTDTRPTFADQPRERVELTGPGRMFGCPDAFPVGWDATAALRQALAHHHRFVTIEVRLAGGAEADPAHGLTFDPAAALQLTFNILPTRPTGLTVDDQACTLRPLLVPAGASPLTLAATVTDPDDGAVGSEFDWWPVADPTQRTEVDRPFSRSGATVRLALSKSTLTDHTTYAWQVRGIDENTTGQEQQVDGPFSRVCLFTTDFTPPPAPVVTSTDFPAVGQGGGVGVPGTFTFSGNGDPDVAAFIVEPDRTDHIPADRPGGTATYEFTPQSTGPKSITVLSVDKAGNVGPATTYRFFVASNAPTVSCSPPNVLIGQPIQCTFTDSDRITGYRYEFGLDPEVTVPADSHGRATVTLTPTDPSGQGNIVVRAVLANGNDSAPAFTVLTVDTAAPTIDQSADDVVVGSPVTFTFHAVLPGSVSFTYTFNDGDPTTVPVGPDGTATATVTPDQTGSAFFDVFSTTASGLRSGTGEAFLHVDTNSPIVTSTDYPAFTVSGGVGDPGTFTLSARAPGVVGYLYIFNGSDIQSVAAGPDGTAEITLTPTVALRTNTLSVVSTFADGSLSDETDYQFRANTAAPGVTCAGQVDGGVLPAGDVTCVLAPVQENVASYTYTVNGGAPVTVAAGADGSASFALTVGADQSPLTISAHSANAAGDSSDDRVATFTVAATVPASVPAGVSRG